MFGTIFLFFFLTNKPFFQNLKFYLLLPDMGGAKQFRGGCEKAFSRDSRAVKFRTPLFKFLYTPLLVVIFRKIDIFLKFSIPHSSRVHN